MSQQNFVLAGKKFENFCFYLILEQKQNLKMVMKQTCCFPVSGLGDCICMNKSVWKSGYMSAYE